MKNQRNKGGQVNDKVPKIMREKINEPLQPLSTASKLNLLNHCI